MKSTTPRKTASRKSTSEVPVATVIPGDSGLGAIQIHEDVIASLVRRAALSVEGVSRLAGNALVDNIAEIVGSHRMQARAVSVELTGGNSVVIEVKLNVLFGYAMPELAAKVQQAVVKLVESATGMTVTAVNVLIQDIEESQMADEAVEDEDENGGETLQ